VSEFAEPLITVPSPQVSGSDTYLFSSWSDGGARTHNIVAPDSPATYTATYVRDSTVPPAGLVAGYGFDELSGLTVSDRSPNANTGTLSGATRALAGRFGGALSFDGVNDWVTVADSASLDLSAAMTLEAWVRPARQRGGGPVLAKQRGKGRAYALSVAPAHRRPAGYVAAKSEKHGGGPRRLPVGEWSHVAMTYDGSRLRLYVDGRRVARVRARGGVRASRQPLWIGGRSSAGAGFGGILDEVRDRALSRSEIRHDLRTPLP